MEEELLSDTSSEPEDAPFSETDCDPYSALITILKQRSQDSAYEAMASGEESKASKGQELQTHPSGREVLRKGSMSEEEVVEAVEIYVRLARRTYWQLRLGMPHHSGYAEHQRVIWLFMGFLVFYFELFRLEEVIEHYRA